MSLTFQILPRLSEIEYRILNLLIVGDGEMTRLQISSMPHAPFTFASSYVILQRMVDKNLLAERREPRTTPPYGIARKFYGVTPFGKKVVEAYRAAQRILDEAKAS